MSKIRLSALVPASLFLVSTSSAPAATFQETFASNPVTQGWHVVGDTNLFHWNSTNQNVEVTWDSSRTNSYFCHPLGLTLGTADDFSLSFDLQLSDFAAGVDPQKPNPFQLAVAFINLAAARQTNFFRGSGSDSPHLVEFSFFPDPGGPWLWGPSLTTVLVDGTGTNWSCCGFAPLALAVDDIFHVTMTYTAGDQTLRTAITRNGQPFVLMPDARPGTNFLDFAVDHIAVCSYSDAGQDPFYSGSILAHGRVDNFTVTTPPPVAKLQAGFTNGLWQTQFRSFTNWLYTLERSSNFLSWDALPPSAPGNGASLILQDTNPPPARAFYRVRAEAL